VSEVTKEMMGAAGAAFQAAVIRNETIQQALRKAIGAALFMQQGATRAGSILRCNEHGGHGFISDCVQCKALGIIS
jgi:hypothetical protein